MGKIQEARRMNFDFMNSVNEHIQQNLAIKAKDTLALQEAQASKIANRIILFASAIFITLVFLLETPH